MRGQLGLAPLIILVLITLLIFGIIRFLVFALCTSIEPALQKHISNRVQVFITLSLLIVGVLLTFLAFPDSIDDWRLIIGEAFVEAGVWTIEAFSVAAVFAALIGIYLAIEWTKKLILRK